MTLPEAIPLAALIISMATFVSSHRALRRKVETEEIALFKARIERLEQALEACEQRNIALMKRLLREELRNE